MTTAKTPTLPAARPAPGPDAPAPAASGAVPAAAPTGEIPPALAAMMTEDERVAAQSEAARWRYGFFSVLTGLIVILVGFVVIALTGDGDDASFAGLVGVAGAIVGAYFGFQIGQSGKARIESELRRTNELAIRLAAKIHAHDADAVINSTMGVRRR
ncbi:hypothetical protein GCM10010156_09320 [Planobispora rosea]|uniref:Uncharacterized protein n=1 Tax=Planobispora rosea TaxID=35762 RepID=A0A8J3RZT0_PLARO|nr:hypothetical protein [Planobispora rosea]GGS52768.1 hypothetical protein GCM10010156_09320 [Planobispora rosea]GIH83097.1 hypothetical protein Pro02_15050 [Planobispora rosea]